MKHPAMPQRLRVPSPALVISLIALFVALGGTTYAATSLPMNSVGTQQIKNGSVELRDLQNGLSSGGSTSTTPQQLHSYYDLIDSTTVNPNRRAWNMLVQATVQVTNNGTLPATLSLAVQMNADIRGGVESAQTIPPGATESVPAGFEWDSHGRHYGKQGVLLLAKSDRPLDVGTRNLNVAVLPGGQGGS